MRSRRPWMLLVFAALGRAQDGPAKAAPEPGLVDPKVAEIGDLVPPASEGTPEDALALYRTAHGTHLAGDLDAALRGYVGFLGCSGRTGLPARYTETVRRCVAALRADVRTRYRNVCVLYAKDREAGLKALGDFAERYSFLPEGEAARVLEQSDGLKAAEREADALAAKGENGRAKERLLQAIRACPRGLFLYEAKKKLIALGGPDLLTPEERVVPKAGGKAGDPEGKKDEPPSTIEFPK